MAINVASWIVLVIGVYMAIGFVFALFFVTRGVGAIDPIAREGTWGFRLIIIPGVMALWPYLAKRWFGGAADPPEENNPHRVAARAAKGGVR